MNFNRIDLMKLALIKRIILSQLLILLFASSYAHTTDSTTIVRRFYHTAVTSSAPAIDGIENDVCWNLVEWTTDFIQSQPVENKPPSQIICMFLSALLIRNRIKSAR
jgi:hypothetical protein